MPFEMAEPIIKKCETAQQLREIELNHPKWTEAGNTANIWQMLIRRDIHEVGQDESKMVQPSNPASWHKVYRMLKRKQASKEKEQEEALRQQLLGQKVQKAEKQALFVPGIMAHARDEKETTKYVDGVPNKSSSNWSKQPPSVKSAKNGHDAIAAMRRNAASHSRQMKIAKPWVSPAQASRQIKRAPESMLREVARQAPQEFAPRELLPHQKDLLKERQRMNANVKIVAPGRLSNAKHAEAVQQRNEAAVRKAREIDEARLRQLTKSENAKARAQAPEKKFDFEASPPRPTTECTVSPQPIVVHRVRSVEIDGRPVAVPVSMSPPKRSSPSPSPPAQPSGIRKRAAPGSIFMTRPKKVVKR